ncbi:SDR family oxidoreductase [Pseudomonas frederiksbergensis]|uniref:SDR family oxidoreductase n=1 Tax=Pseudomonas frederiksbergensis TaxID=104087 RepID=UPI003CFD1AC6
MTAKTILITGASRGIGRAVAILAAQRGWSVIVNYLHNDLAAQHVVDRVKALGARSIKIQGDVASEDDVIRVFQEASKFGPLNGVVINAGIVSPPLALVDMTLDRLQRMFDVNVLGAYLCAREAARQMIKSRGGNGGSIVLVSSIAAVSGSPNEFIDYAGSKGAVDTLTKGLAKELGPHGVRVNAVRPGLIDTEIHASGGQPDRARSRGVNTPLGRPGSAEEVAEAIIWLLSDLSSYNTGTLLDVTGGV